MASRTPGDLGVYGFRNRSDHTYDGGFIAMSDAIREPRLWDLVTRAGGSSVVLSVPGTYPPKPLNGVMVSLLPDAVAREQVHVSRGAAGRDRGRRRRVPLRHQGLPHRRQGLPPPPGLRDDRPALQARRAPARRPSRGPSSRWSRWAPTGCTTGSGSSWIPSTASTSPGTTYESAILDYHRHVDGLIAGLLAHADEDTVVLVVSDHGAKRLDGGIRINEWLRREGLLATLAEPNGVSSLRDVGVDWPKTTAWGEGGYYARVFLNVQGREPDGVVPADEYEAVRDDLARRIAAIPDDAGQPDPDRRVQAGRALRRAAGRRAGPDRRLRRPAVALGRDDRRRRGRPDARERHGPGRREPRAGRPLHRRRPGRRGPRPRRRAPARHRADGARDPRHRGARRGCAGAACCHCSRPADTYNPPRS